MKTIIIYVSVHHGNTKKVIEAIASKNDVKVFDVLSKERIDLEEYDCIGIASGIAYGKYYPQMIKFVENNLPGSKKVFFIHTAGSPRENHNSAVKAVAESKGCECLGAYFCKGFDTYGPFKLIGGIAKGHPDSAEIQGAIDFFDKISK
ncbi:MAG: flavodoxin [Clostridia bacterium]|nr:flavodoxin [Clostridia bacterium]